MTSRTGSGDVLGATEPDHVGLVGSEVPRLWTRPLRPLTPRTSLGFEVIDFARAFLGVELYPWQRWLLIHALELNRDGTFRFRRVIVLVARQNGKSLLAAVLAAWWLFVDSDRFPDRLPPFRFKVLGTAQNLDTAQDVWDTVGMWCDVENEMHTPALARVIRKIQRKNGAPGIFTKKGAHYLVRAASRKGGRGKAAARVLMDEMREQHTWDAWDSVSQTTKAVFNSQLWGISNAGDARSVVLRKQRDNLIADIEAWLARGIEELEAYANGELAAPTSALFEWSAPDGCDVDDVDGILQANPSIGHGEITVEQCLQDAHDMPESSYRTEVLCQWVTADVVSYVNTRDWADAEDAGSHIDVDSPIVMGIDTAFDRTRSYIAVAGWRPDELAHVEVVAERAGMLWVISVALKLAEEHGIRRCVIQGRGAPAREFIDPLREAGLEVVEVVGSDLGTATGRFRDRVRDKTLRHLRQPLVDVAISGTVTKTLTDMQFWDRKGSLVDAAPVVAESWALFGLESTPTSEPESAYEDHDLLVV